MKVYGSRIKKKISPWWLLWWFPSSRYYLKFLFQVLLFYRCVSGTCFFWLLGNPVSACEGCVKTRLGNCCYFCIYVVFYCINYTCFFGEWICMYTNTGFSFLSLQSKAIKWLLKLASLLNEMTYKKSNTACYSILTRVTWPVTQFSPSKRQSFSKWILI